MVTGIVQGVGFRPFVYQLAQRLSLSGFVLNDGDGVMIEIEGDAADHKAFIDTLTQTPPPLARIDSISQDEIPYTKARGFSIRRSHQSSASTMVSPDIAICDACAAEMQDPSNRRYGYAFINCTDCGPRYSIIKALPYDRPNTSMAHFTMCKACGGEYADPMDRRYHAQPISCYDCGPTIALLDLDGAVTAQGNEAISRVCTLILQGKTVAIKGLGGFHLVCDASSEEAVAALRRNKRRPSKPLAVMFKDMASLKEAADVTEEEERQILSKERPIVIADKSSRSALAPSIAPNIDRIGVFLAYTPLHLLLLEKLDRPVVATSANISDEPIITDADSVLKKLDKVVYAVLDYDRAIVNACDDSVAMMAGGQRLLMRMARGFGPKSLPLRQKTPKKILAVGANQKNSIALAFGEHLVLSPHIGDLVSLEAFEYFERTLETFKRFYGFQPDVVVCDTHPGYETTKWAKQLAKERLSVELIAVQHHYAHALACMAEYELQEQVLAFCFDGTGYGADGTLWGGEVLVADPMQYERVNHIRPFRLLGGEKAVKEPRRVALALLFECFSLEEVMALENPAVRSFTQAQLKTMHKMWEQGINAPLSSSAGRLFDAVASLSGIAQELGYEGESGLLIEAAAKKTDGEAFTCVMGNGEIDCRPMIKEIVAISSKNEIASRFISMLSGVILETAEQYPQLPIVLSGGVFQNRSLVVAVTEAMKARGRRCYIQQDTPVNDGGIALGQLYHALHKSGRNNG
ncbi:carbamoyltransferase HypF [Sulfurimonas sp. HSL3-7]|uniref:carbamoyltransferase HypF n=1 Tax=Sulfonitrofixus jiaomeiensis TaxID=3131938 RepID=UPI0031F7CAAD